MSMGGDAADQSMKMMLDGTEVLVKLAGKGAGNLAKYLFQLLKKKGQKTRGETRLIKMFKTGRDLKFFDIDENDKERLAAQAKDHGVVFAAVKDKENPHRLEICVYADDAAKVNRVLEKLKLTDVQMTDLKRGKTSEKIADEPNQDNKTETVEIDGEEIPFVVNEGFGFQQKDEKTEPIEVDFQEVINFTSEETMTEGTGNPSADSSPSKGSSSQDGFDIGRIDFLKKTTPQFDPNPFYEHLQQQTAVANEYGMVSPDNAHPSDTGMGSFSTVPDIMFEKHSTEAALDASIYQGWTVDQIRSRYGESSVAVQQTEQGMMVHFSMNPNADPTVNNKMFYADKQGRVLAVRDLSRPDAPILPVKNASERGPLDSNRKPSVRQELKQIKAEQQRGLPFRVQSKDHVKVPSAKGKAR